MTEWLTSLRDRPIGDGERGAAMATVTVLLIAAAILLVLSQPGGQSQTASQQHPARNVIPSAPALHARASANSPVPLTPGIAQAADLFLVGYLGYLYGHSPASAIKGATTAFAHSLQADPPRVSPVMRTRQAHVLALHTIAAPAGLVGVSAIVNDSGIVDYSIGLLLLPHDGRLLVSGLEGGE